MKSAAQREPSFLLFVLIACCAALLGGQHAFAQTAPGIPAIPLRAIEDPADRLLREQRDRQRDQLGKEAPPIRVSEQMSEYDRISPAQIPETDATFPIKQVRINGNTLLRASELNNVTRAFEGLDLGGNRINALLRRITRLYFERGYVTTRVYVSPQNLREGTIEVSVVEGFVEKIIYNDQPTGRAFAWTTPLRVNAKLSLWDLEQALEQINRLQSNHAELQILPGETPGGSVVSFTAKPESRWRAGLGTDNYGQASSGVVRTRVSLDLDNLTGLQDGSTLTYTGSTNTNSLLWAFSVPKGYNLFSYSAAYSEYQSPISDFAILFGDSRVQNFSWSRVLHRAARSRSTFDLSLSHRQSRRFIDDTQLLPQKLSSVRASYSYFLKLNELSNATFELANVRGINAFQSIIDAPNLPVDSAHAQFSKWEAGATVQWRALGNFQIKNALFGQYSRTGLYGSDQIYVGGISSVRGYKESTLVGDQGGYSRNDVSKRFEQQLFGFDIGLEPYICLDGGLAKQVFENKFRMLAGGGAGLRLGSRGLSVDLLAAHSLAASRSVRKESQFFASLNYRF
jgi:hemolysin activation/secretion protein